MRKVAEGSPGREIFHPDYVRLRLDPTSFNGRSLVLLPNARLLENLPISDLQDWLRPLACQAKLLTANVL